MANRIYTVEYQIGTFHGFEDVVADENADNLHIYAKAEKQACDAVGLQPSLSTIQFRIVSWRACES